MLDDCVWIPHFHCGLVADKLPDAIELLKRAFRWTYETMGKKNHDDAEPSDIHKLLNHQFREHMAREGVKDFRTRDNDRMVQFINGSSCYVDTSMRSAALARLHISEFGPISVARPEIAKEIMEGSLPALALDAKVTIESTAEGMEGEFYDVCEAAQQTGREVEANPRKLTAKEWQFVFFPWFDDPVNQFSDEDTTNVVITQRHQDYFDMLSTEHDINLTRNQVAWYVSTEVQELGDSMKKEHPSYPEEAFMASAEGNYYRPAFMDIDRQGRICGVPINNNVLTDTWWDIGINDPTAIWFSQTVGREIHLVDYYENSGEALRHYIDVLRERAEKNGYTYGRHVGPHDLAQRELSEGQSRVEAAAALGLEFEVTPRIKSQQEGIDAVRRILPMCWFDEIRCRQQSHNQTVGINSLRGYRKEWNERLGTWASSPLHNWASHGAKAFECLALMWGTGTAWGGSRNITNQKGVIRT